MPRRGWIIGGAVVLIVACVACAGVLIAAELFARSVPEPPAPARIYGTPLAVRPIQAPTFTPVPNSTPPPTSLPAATLPPPTAMIPTPRAAIAPTVAPPPDQASAFEQICKRDQSLTDAQFQKAMQGYVGQKIANWHGWVTDVFSQSDGYDVYIAMDAPGGLFWSRDIVAYGVPADLAATLSKKQPITFSGTIRGVGIFLGGACNPLEIEKTSLEAE